MKDTGDVNSTCTPADMVVSSGEDMGRGVTQSGNPTLPEPHPQQHQNFDKLETVWVCETKRRPIQVRYARIRTLQFYLEDIIN